MLSTSFMNEKLVILATVAYSRGEQRARKANLLDLRLDICNAHTTNHVQVHIFSSLSVILDRSYSLSFSLPLSLSTSHIHTYISIKHIQSEHNEHNIRIYIYMCIGERRRERFTCVWTSRNTSSMAPLLHVITAVICFCVSCTFICLNTFPVLLV